MKLPDMRLDGSCAACVGGWMCEYHKRETAIAWNKRQAVLRESAHLGREYELQRIMSRHELESDEFFTAREKAVMYL